MYEEIKRYVQNIFFSIYLHVIHLLWLPMLLRTVSFLHKIKKMHFHKNSELDYKYLDD